MANHSDPDPGSSSANYDLLDRLADEFAERFRRGERPSLEDYISRYPALADDIRALFPAMVHLERADEARQVVAEDQSGTAPPVPAPALAHMGDYRVLREIGHGGMGVVYEAEQVSLGRRVAVKILPQHVARDVKMLERFRREARAAARLHHTNIVPVFEVGREGDVCYYAMQFIQGQALDVVYDELRRLRGRVKESEQTGPPTGTTGTATHAERAAVGQVAHSLLTGKFGDDPPSAADGGAAVFPAVLAGTVAEPAGAELATGVFTPAGDPERGLAITEAGSVAGSRETGPNPPPLSPGHSSLSATSSSSAISAVMPGGSQISTVEAGCREYARSIARIGLQAAQGLAYAHARGVIHRDIKPSNLLLDTAGVVWITDFGLAKADGDGLTQTGDILGTLRYMAPERFGGTADARADVYSLGLTLYELLTLEPAFDTADRLRLIEQIKSIEPVRPRQVDHRLPRDLETIILKAIDKDARRRYQTADELAEDLRRFRDDEPILARRATAVERYSRWARRNPGVAVLGGVLTAVLIMATVASLIVAGRMAALAERQRQAAQSEREAKLAERKAHEREVELRQQAETALAETEVERNRAEENFQRARAVVDQYFTQVSESQLLSVPGLQTLRRDLLRSALNFYEDYLRRRGADPGLQAALAAVHLKAAKIHLELGDRAAAEKDYRLALPLYETLAKAPSTRADVETRNGLAECHHGLGECGPAGQPRRDALLRSAAIRQELVSTHPNDTQLREDLARSYQDLGESQRSDKQIKQALDSYLKARDIVASLVGDHPEVPAYRHDFARNLAAIAQCLCDLGRHQDETIVRPMAIDHARAAYELAPQVMSYGLLYGQLLTKEGDNLGFQNRFEESNQSLRLAVKVKEKLIRENPAVPELPRELSWTYIDLVARLAPERRLSDSVPLLRQGCALLESLPGRGPDQLYALGELLALRSTKLELTRPFREDEARRRQDQDQAVEAFRQAIAAGFREAKALRSRARTYYPNLLEREDVKAMLTDLEAREKAETLARETGPSADQGETSGTTPPAVKDAKQPSAEARDRLLADLAATEHAIALIRFEMGKSLEAKGDFDGALVELREAVRLQPDDAALRGRLDATIKARAERDEAVVTLRREAAGLQPGDSAGHLALGRKMREKKDLEGAIAEFRVAIKIKPDGPEAQAALAETLEQRGDRDAALTERRQLLRLKPGDAIAHYNLGMALKKQGMTDLALEELREATRLDADHDHVGFAIRDLGSTLRDLGRPDETIAIYRHLLKQPRVEIEAHLGLGNALLNQENYEEAAVEFREALRMNPDHVDAHSKLGKALQARGDMVGAVAEYRRVARLKPDDSSARDQLVDALKIAGDLAGAEAVLRAAKSGDDAFASHLELAQKWLDKRDFRGAAEEFDKALLVLPRNAEAQRKLADALRQAGEVDTAVTHFRAAIQLEPNIGWVHNSLGLALEATHDLDGAATEFRTAIRVDGGRYPVQHSNLARVLMARNEIDGAIAAARSALAIQRDYLPAVRQLGPALVSRGALDEALAAYRGAYQEPGQAEAEYATTLRRSGRFAQAVAADRESIGIHPGNPLTHFDLGLALMALRDHDGAIAAFREAIRLKPDHAPSVDNLITALKLRKEQADLLAAAVSSTSKLDRELARAIDTLMAPLMVRILPDAGIAVLDELIRDQPKQVRFRVARAQSLAALGRHNEAAAEFAQALALPSNERPTWFAVDPSGVYLAAATDSEVFESLTRLRPDDRNLLIARAYCLGQKRAWREAAAVATRCNALDPPDDSSWHHEAVLRAWIGDVEGYQRVCGGMRERFESSDDPSHARRTVLNCLLEPGGVPDPGQLAQLVDRFAGTAPVNRNLYSILAVGLYEYRLGHYRAALDRVGPVPEAKTAEESQQTVRAFACVIRAMALQKLDQGQEARRQLDMAEAQARQTSFDPGRPGPLSRQWNDWLRYIILRREAEALLRDPASPAAR